MKRTTFICQLDNETRRRIKRAIARFYRANFPDLDRAERAELVNGAMCGRLADLEENIDLDRMHL